MSNLAMMAAMASPARPSAKCRDEVEVQERRAPAAGSGREPMRPLQMKSVINAPAGHARALRVPRCTLD
eukprot:6545719-Lingulodinium_polyedra.AAC.1